MRPNILFDQLRDGKVSLGLALMYKDAGLVEGMYREGWDWIWIDGQHGQLSYDGCLAAVRASEAVGLETIVRAPGHEYGIIGPMLDLAPSGIMIPMVNNAEEARNIVNATRFPPLGNRSYGGRRVYDMDGTDYYKEREMIVIAQIETVEAVKNAEEIINTDGIDLLLFSADDMRIQMGLPVTSAIDENPELWEAMVKVAKVAKDAGKFSGCAAFNASWLQKVVALGYQLIIGGSDIYFIVTSTPKQLKILQDALGNKNSAAASEDPSGSSMYGGQAKDK